MIKVTDNLNRGVLFEGRNYQMGFAFLKKVKPDQYETVQPISPCKDYMNDVVWAEQTGKVCKAYGLKYTPQDLFKGKSAFVYMGIKICDKQSGWGRYAGNIENDRKNLRENYKNIETLMREVEKSLKISGKTAILPTEDPDTFLVILPKKWVESTWLTSLYSLLMRAAQGYDGKMDIYEYFKQSANLHIERDLYLLNQAIEVLKEWSTEGIPAQDPNQFSVGNENVHKCGIIDYANSKKYQPVI